MKFSLIVILVALSGSAFAQDLTCSDAGANSNAELAMNATASSIVLGSDGIVSKGIVNCKPYWMEQTLGLDHAPAVPNDADACGIEVGFANKAAELNFAKKLYVHSVNQDGHLIVEDSAGEHSVPVCGRVSGPISAQPGATVSN